MTVTSVVPPTLSSTRFTRSFEKRVAGVIRDKHLIDPGARVLVAVSGGADSTALLVALSSLRKNHDIKLVAAHFDHRLRSREEADGDAAYVRKLTRLVGAKAEFGSGDVRTRARRKRESIEEAARAMRYNFLKRTARATNCTIVAVAHHRGDQAETVLMNLMRGAGLGGLSGMRARSSWPLGSGPDVVRPLLRLTDRASVERYCKDLHLQPRRDPTNDLPAATRNRVRNELLPLLRTFNPKIGDALVRLADNALMDTQFQDMTVEVMFTESSFTEVTPAAVRFVRNGFLGLPLALTVRLVRRAFAQLIGSTAGLESAHIQSIVRSLGKRRGTTALPGGLYARTTVDWVTISRDSSVTEAHIDARRLRIPGTVDASQWRFVATRLKEVPPIAVAQSALEARIDLDKVIRPLVVRSRRPGDGIRPLGLNGTKKVQDIFVDAKVPVEERGDVPIICDRDGPVWIVGHRLHERVAITDATRRVLSIRASQTGS
jgi:tRNA(Ile)-lysidine synthase